ncbi:MAG: adenosylcobinamide-GDP ribazoletransferase, partial [Actinomycetota bacterium]|nr:adenosylcobinamide-GDP ribazoletransferase [Actinomycetota bacterium]
DGLGALVAGAVPWPLLGLATVSVVLPVAVLALALPWLGLLAAVPAGLLAAYALERRAVRRLGGTTGDVFGALIETATTVALVVLALG